ncbi:hypothetical protein ACH5RR_002824 [Cinchona calisaya]|uniref:Uncharacterized protein n=1 Tax=Cinchona calisaya TaxID=153742 RepID=A0ABD3ATE2_9GENT
MPKKDVDSDIYGGADEQLEKIMKTERFKPDKAFARTSMRSSSRDNLVKYEKEAEEADPFGLYQFIYDVKIAKVGIPIEQLLQVISALFLRLGYGLPYEFLTYKKCVAVSAFLYLI